MDDVLENLRRNSMMAHLLDSLEAGSDIGHYGRLVFTMVAQYFMDEGDFVSWMQKDPSMDEVHAKALWHQVREKGYNPPSRDKVLDFHHRQDFPIIPDPGDPDSGNVYRDLEFPEDVYEHIEEYHIDKVRQGE